MSVVVVGSVALDTIHTPTRSHQDLVGGSAFYFSLAAAHFTRVRVVAVVGEDFPAAELAVLEGRGIDLGGLTRASGPTFRWEGRYEEDPNVRRTLGTRLGVFEDFHPRLPTAWRDASALFLANIDPALQLEVLAQVGQVELVAVDTMNYWITRDAAAVERVIARAHVLLINDEEARLLTGDAHVPRAAETIRARGPEVVVIKKGAHGAAALGPWGWLLFPAMPVATVQDPTGAGDAFAGGLVGYLAGRDWRSRDRFAEGMAVGTAVASLVVEQFGVRGIATDQRAELHARCSALRAAMAFVVPDCLA
jgi:sugar/nucleoside kinase (ribokinase family)